MKILKLLRKTGSAHEGYIGEYGEEEAKRLLDSGAAEKYVPPVKKTKFKLTKED